jgi:hypothetical protein
MRWNACSVVVGAGLAAALGSACIPGVDSDRTEAPSVVPGAKRAFPPPSFGDVVTADRPPPPISGGTLRVLADGRTAIAADPDRDRIFAVDLARKQVVADVALEAGDEPGRSVEDAAGRVHVVLRGGGALVTLAPPTFAVVARRPLCPAPRGIAFEAASNLLHVACAGGELVSLSAEPSVLEPSRTVFLERDLRDVIVGRGQLLVSRFRAADILVVGPSGSIVSRMRPASRPSVRFSEPRSSKEPTEVLSTPGVAYRMVPLASGEVLVLHQMASGDDVSTAPGGYQGGECGGGLVQSVVSRLGLGDRPGPSLFGATVAVDVAVSPDETRLAVVSAGSGHSQGSPRILQLGMQDLDNSGSCVPGTGPGSRAPAPRPPLAVDGGAPAPDGGAPPEEEVIAAVQPEGEPIAVAFTPRGHIVVQTREPAALEVITSRTRIVLSYESRADSGHALFHANAGAGLACASCHPEGGDDGRVWTFQKVGPRRTQSLRGGILATAPFHWNGDLPDISHLMKEVFESRMGGPAVSPAHHKALGRWLDAIPTLPQAGPRAPEAVERGRALFLSPAVACAKCHAGSLETDNRTVDVGTGRALQVPSLRGLAFRAPFMHDGCATTLADRFRSRACGGGDKHGVTSRLDDAQLADLIAFLETL